MLGRSGGDRALDVGRDGHVDRHDGVLPGQLAGGLTQPRLVTSGEDAAVAPLREETSRRQTDTGGCSDDQDHVRLVHHGSDGRTGVLTPEPAGWVR